MGQLYDDFEIREAYVTKILVSVPDWVFIALAILAAASPCLYEKKEEKFYFQLILIVSLMFAFTAYHEIIFQPMLLLLQQLSG